MSRRFASWPANARIGVLVFLVVVTAALTLAVGPLRDYAAGRDDQSDADLYRAIATRVQHGEPFYPSAVREQLDRGYPVRPAMTVREPTLSWFLAGIGGWRHGFLPLAALAVVAALAMVRRLETVDRRRGFFLLSGLGALAAFGPYVGPVQVTQHECWAGLLIALSLTLRTSERFVAAVLTGLAACLVRELAAPYLVMMAAAAWAEHRGREALSWLAAAAAFAVAYGAHLWRVGRETSAGDPRSPGWWAVDGLPHLLETIRHTTVASAGPDVVSVLVLVLGLLGWVSVRSAFAHRTVAWIAMWATATMIVGRPENVVWGFVWVGPLVVGLVLAPGALWALCVGDRAT